MHRYREQIYAAYTSSIYAGLNKLDEAGYQEYARVVMPAYSRFLPSNREAQVLDAGCGTGMFLYALREAGYTNCRGVDISQEQVDVAKGFGLDAICENAVEFLRDKNETHDLIIAKDFLEHLTKDEVLDLVSLVRQALRPGGTFICTVPNANSPFAARFRYRDLTHEQLFTHETLQQVFSACGLTAQHICGEALKPPSLKGWIRCGLRFVLRRFWRAFLMAEFGSNAGTIPIEPTLVGVARKQDGPESEAAASDQRGTK